MEGPAIADEPDESVEEQPFAGDTVKQHTTEELATSNQQNQLSTRGDRMVCSINWMQWPACESSPHDLNAM
jgi:hypothetical protein